MAIICCKECVAPKRHHGCHDHCPEYLTEKAKNDERREKEFKANEVSNGLYRQREMAVARSTKKQHKRSLRGGQQ